MEKIKKSISKIFPYVKLYRDDIDELIEILEENKFKDIEIRTGNYKLNSSEIEKLKERKISNIQISAYDPFFISVELNSRYGSNGARVYTSEDSTIALGVIGKISQLFKKNRRFILTLTTTPWFALSVVMAGQILAILLKKFFDNTPLFITLLICSYAFFLFAFFLDSGYLFSKNLVILDYRIDRPNFWIRNKDKLLITLLTVILTALVTYYITIWTK